MGVFFISQRAKPYLAPNYLSENVFLYINTKEGRKKKPHPVGMRLSGSVYLVKLVYSAFWASGSLVVWPFSKASFLSSAISAKPASANSAASSS